MIRSLSRTYAATQLILVAVLGMLAAGCGGANQVAPSPASRPAAPSAAVAVSDVEVPQEPTESPVDPRPSDNQPQLPPDDRQTRSATQLEGDYARLQGRWKVVKFQIGAREFPRQSSPAIFEGMTLTFPPIWDEMTYQLNPDASPKTIDFFPTSGRDKEYAWPGIYELDGDELRICYIQNADEPRPEGFPTERINPHRVFVLQREAAAE